MVWELLGVHTCTTSELLQKLNIVCHLGFFAPYSGSLFSPGTLNVAKATISHSEVWPILHMFAVGNASTANNPNPCDALHTVTSLFVLQLPVWPCSVALGSPGFPTMA